jgi:hypothetical protein
MNREKIYINLPNRGEYLFEALKESIVYARKEEWQKKKWFPRNALIDKVGGGARLYTGQEFNPEHIDLIEKGWTHDHCDICVLGLHKDSVVISYFDGYDWVCDQCYDLFIISTDLEKTLNKLLEE